MIDLDLTGRTAFVSGSTQGIGLAIAQRLALAGPVRGWRSTAAVHSGWRRRSMPWSVPGSTRRG
ncbi:hypothetical protein ACTXMW_12060 [Brachybacterium paraconglomeratum]|uniref:hypothetical protein n=1 Tax=Brachybacterium paraconglomeratum TaxID=173362 RepID=UPI003FD57C0B